MNTGIPTNIQLVIARFLKHQQYGFTVKNRGPWPWVGFRKSYDLLMVTWQWKRSQCVRDTSHQWDMLRMTSKIPRPIRKLRLFLKHFPSNYVTILFLCSTLRRPQTKIYHFTIYSTSLRWITETMLQRELVTLKCHSLLYMTCLRYVAMNSL